MIKKITYIGVVIIVSLLTSCVGFHSTYVPIAKSMLNVVSFKDMKLTPNDYEILDRVEATSRITVEINGGEMKIEDPDGEFLLEYRMGASTNVGETKWILWDFKGVLRAGFLSEWGSVENTDPVEIVNRLALYRLIQLVREQGGDYVIEPIFSTAFEGESSTDRHGRIDGKHLTYKTTVSGKSIRLKTKK